VFTPSLRWLTVPQLRTTAVESHSREKDGISCPVSDCRSSVFTSPGSYEESSTTPRIQINAAKGDQVTSIKGEVILSASLSPRPILSFIYHRSPRRDASELYHVLKSDHQPTESHERFVLCC